VVRHQTDHNSRNHHVEEATQGQGQAHSQWKITPRILHLEITLTNPIKGDHATAHKLEQHLQEHKLHFVHECKLTSSAVLATVSKPMNAKKRVADPERTPLTPLAK